jgi:hypothetical protein
MSQRVKQAAKKLDTLTLDERAVSTSHASVAHVLAAAAGKDPVVSIKPQAAAKRTKSTEADREDLTAALEAAHARIAQLEEAQTLVVNRINWMIETLESLKSGKTEK